MDTLKKKLRKVLGFASISVILALAGIVFGLPAKENKNQANYQPENNYASGLKAETEQPKLICSNFLEQDENSLFFEEYSKDNKVAAVQCVSVGCGGIF